MISPTLQATARAEEPETFPAAARALALAALLALGAPGVAMAQQDAEQAGGALTQQELNQINNRPIVSPAKTQINKPREPSFKLDEPDGTQIREYRNKGQATDIEVKSGVGTRYQMSKPEDSSPKIRDREMNRVPSVNVLQF
ncbi:hypothetical protein P3W85_27125 [Cupriavidus basilensis]|uniref:DUF2782 domain-containing protein n=1 Tax=Cupriavidus basilensis TaxID=68895 RepID=A0ABT6AVE3_9BURK|nr:hypothetical protein [Cupriavidus basilensis]MDF3836600.1 hypothetical protein [Cupriavidus basilensis]